MTHPAFVVQLPNDLQASRAQLEATLLDTLAVAVVDALPEEQLPAFERVLADGNDASIQAFLEEHVPRVRDELAEIAGHFSARIKALA